MKHTYSSHSNFVPHPKPKRQPEQQAAYIDNFGYLSGQMMNAAPFYPMPPTILSSDNSAFKEQQSKKKRTVIKPQNINTQHRRIPSVNLPYQGITNHTLTRLNKLQTPFLPTGLSTRSGRFIGSSQPQLLMPSQIQYLGGTMHSSKKNRAYTHTLLQMIGDGIQSERSAFRKPIVTKSAVFTSRQNNDTQNADIRENQPKFPASSTLSASSLRCGVGENLVGSSVEVPMPSRMRQSVLDGVEKEEELQKVHDKKKKPKIHLDVNSRQFSPDYSRNPSSFARSGNSSSTQSSSYERKENKARFPGARKPLLPISNAASGDDNLLLECQESIIDEEQRKADKNEEPVLQEIEERPGVEGHASLCSDDGRLSIPSQKSRSYHLPPSTALLAFRVNQRSPPQAITEPEDEDQEIQDEHTKGKDSPFISSGVNLVLPAPLPDFVEDTQSPRMSKSRQNLATPPKKQLYKQDSSSNLPHQNQENQRPKDEGIFNTTTLKREKTVTSGRNEFVDAQIINFWVFREAEYQADPMYLQRQTNISSDMRAILLDWMIQVHSQFRSKRETLATSISIVDRYLSFTEEEVQKSEFQLIGCTAMFIAAKMEEVISPKIGDYVLSTENGYSDYQIRQMQQKILKTLNWLVSPITYAHWSNWYSQEWDNFLTNNDYVQSHPALEFSLHKLSAVQLHTANSESYEVFREFMQVMDAIQMDVYSLQYSVRAVIASVLYLGLGQNLKQLSHHQITKEIPYHSGLILSPSLPWNDLYEHFLVAKFGFTLSEVLPTIQYVARFFELPMDFSIPGVKPEGPYEEFLAFQTHNPNSLDFVRSLLN